MNLKEANSELRKIDNLIEYYQQKLDLLFYKTQPQGIGAKEISVQGGTPNNAFDNYVIQKESIEQCLKSLYQQKIIIEKYIEKELNRIKLFDDAEQLVIYYKEECLENYTWFQISQKVHYSVATCKRIYKRFKEKRKNEPMWADFNVIFVIVEN